MRYLMYEIFDVWDMMYEKLDAAVDAWDLMYEMMNDIR